MKRFRMIAATSCKAESYAEKVIPSLGKIVRIVATRKTSTQTARWRENGEINKSSITTWREYLFVHGEKGYARIQGVCWGYYGEGPRALYKILLMCNIHPDRAKELAYNTKRLDRDGDSWNVQLA